MTRVADVMRRVVAVVFMAFLVAACTSTGPLPPVASTPPPSSVARWQATLLGAPALASGRLVGRLVMTYEPYLSAPPANPISFTAVCKTCTGPTLLLSGSLVLTPEFCSGAPSQTQPPPNSKTCWSAPITFLSAGTWHLTSPYDVDLVVPPSGAVSPPLSASQCTSDSATAAQVIARYFDLSAGGSVAAISDCFAQGWRGQASFPDGAALWAKAGPASNVRIQSFDQAKGCDRFSVSAQLANASAVNWSGDRFFVVGHESGRVRIYELATGLVTPALAATTCQ